LYDCNTYIKFFSFNNECASDKFETKKLRITLMSYALNLTDIITGTKFTIPVDPSVDPIVSQIRKSVIAISSGLR